MLHQFSSLELTDIECLNCLYTIQILMISQYLLPAAVAIGNPFTAKGHVSELQSSPQLYQPSIEPEHTGTEEQRSHNKAKYRTTLLFGGELEENMGVDFMGYDLGRAFHVEVLPVQAHERLQGHGLLSSHG